MSNGLVGTYLLAILVGVSVLAMLPVALLDRRYKTPVGPVFLGLVGFAAYSGAIEHYLSHPDWPLSERLHAAGAKVPALMLMFATYAGIRYYLRRRDLRADKKVGQS